MADAAVDRRINLSTTVSDEEFEELKQQSIKKGREYIKEMAWFSNLAEARGIDTCEFNRAVLPEDDFVPAWSLLDIENSGDQGRSSPSVMSDAEFDDIRQKLVEKGRKYIEEMVHVSNLAKLRGEDIEESGFGSGDDEFEAMVQGFIEQGLQYIGSTELILDSESSDAVEDQVQCRRSITDARDTLKRLSLQIP